MAGSYASETNTERHYFTQGKRMYSDKVGKFIVKCNESSAGAVARRLARVYTDLYVDECQDLAAWDWDVVEMIMRSGVRVTLVGDPRQYVYRTNPASRYSQFGGVMVTKLFAQWEKAGLCTTESMAGSHRCNGPICDFANRLWPAMPPMEALQTTHSGHDGVFLVATGLVSDYVREFGPQLLRYSVASKTHGFSAMNFGMSKGQQFDRVLIYPTAPIAKYLKSGDLTPVEPSKTKLHVAVTRAKHSVGFVFDGHSSVVSNRWTKASGIISPCNYLGPSPR